MKKAAVIRKIFEGTYYYLKTIEENHKERVITWTAHPEHAQEFGTVREAEDKIASEELMSVAAVFRVTEETVKESSRKRGRRGEKA